MRKIPLILVISMVLACGLAFQAAASVVPTPISVIDVPKGTFSLTPPFANVFITVNAGTAHVKVEALSDSDGNYYMSEFLGLNLSQAATAVVNTIVFSTPYGNNQTPGFDHQSTTTPNNIKNTFGLFNLNLFFDDTGFNGSFHDIEFDLTGTWSNANSVLALNAKDFDAYSHFFNFNGSNTGFAAEGSGHPPGAPIPGSLVLLGSGLVGLLGLRRKL